MQRKSSTMNLRTVTTVSRLIIFVSAIAYVFGFGLVARGYGQQNAASWSPKLESADDGEVHILPVRGNVYMLAGAGANLTVHAGNEGVLLVDTGMASMTDKVFNAIRKISSRPLRYIVNRASMIHMRQVMHHSFRAENSFHSG